MHAAATLVVACIAALGGAADAYDTKTTYSGDVTAYSSSWEGHNCGYTSLWSEHASAAQTYFAAMNNPMWDNKMACGRCAQVKCMSPECAQKGGRPITVMITDRCPECLTGSLDLSIQGFKELTGSEPARFKIEWQFVECPSTFVSGNVEYFIKPGSNAFWVALQPRNYQKMVTKLQVKAQGSGDWFTLADPKQNNIDAYYFLAEIPGGFPDGPFQVRAYADDGSFIEDSFKSLPLGKSMYASHQFGSVGAANPSSMPAPAPVPTPAPAPSSEVETPAPSSEVEMPAPTEAASQPSAEPVQAPQPSPPSLKCSACPFGITATLTEWSGGFAFQVSIDNSLAVALQKWHVHVATNNFGSAAQSWDCQAHANHQGLGFEMVPEPYNAVLVGGTSRLVVIATTKDAQQPSAVANGVMYFLDANGIPGSCPIAMSSLQEQSNALAVENAASDGVSGPLSIVAITCAVVGVVGAILLAVYVRRQLRQRQDLEPSIMTPANFEVFTPVSVL